MGPAPGCCVLHLAENEDPVHWRIPTSIYHHRAYPALSEDHVRREAGKAFANEVEDLIKNSAVTGRRENSEPGSQAGHLADTSEDTADKEDLVHAVVKLHAVLSASPADLNCFLEEMIAVLDTSSHIPQSSPGDEQPSYALHLSGCGTVSAEGLNVDTRMMCAKTVFTLIDFLWRFMREWISAYYLSSTQKDDPVYNAVKDIGFSEGLCGLSFGACATLRLLGSVTLMNMHASTEEKEEEVKDYFSQQMEDTYDSIPSNDIKVILGDLNAKIGKEKEFFFLGVIETESLHDTTNHNGIKLIDFAESKNLIISSTYFPHKNIHKRTWAALDGVTLNQIDHVLIEK
ncbi:hypothetical protein B7P43_G18287 [Cryptotermes secundus]|uniref:Endonuclease/exonuclease/phosphatase domain-containing protein n=1 Tax=Cryptotermes secundus TaxID=105785 RepID=A0A2J7R480_9NEOP|nr:hypothetical protein B7P43_G18287 [Cryptotermes secundus]